MTKFVKDDELSDFLADIGDTIDAVTDEMPDHGEFLSRLPPNTPPKSAPHPSISFNLSYERGSAT